MLTPRLEVRLPRESDRSRFVELFCDEDFMVFSLGVLTPDAAHRRFDAMPTRAAELPFAKQPIIDRGTGTIVGYAGVDRFDFEGRRRLEYGYRLVPEARGLGCRSGRADPVRSVVTWVTARSQDLGGRRLEASRSRSATAAPPAGLSQ